MWLYRVFTAFCSLDPDGAHIIAVLRNWEEQQDTFSDYCIHWVLSTTGPVVSWLTAFQHLWPQEGRYLFYWGTCFGEEAYVYTCVDEYACVRRPNIRDRWVFSLIDFFMDWGRVSCWTQSLLVWCSNMALWSPVSPSWVSGIQVGSYLLGSYGSAGN